VRHEEVIARIDLFELLRKLKIEGRVQGREFIARCPFPDHDDSSPSFSMAIDGPKKGLHQCFGCGSSGNTLHLVQRCLDVDRQEAERTLAKWFGLNVVIYSPTSKEIIDLLNRSDEGDIEEDMIRIPLPRLSERDDVPVEYLMDVRGYDFDQAREICDAFRIGWSDSGYYRNRLIIPILDSIGSQITFEACALSPDTAPKKLYPKGSPMARLLFNQSNVTSEYVWVVEGLFDAIRIWSYGEPVIATFGAHLSKFQARMIINKFQEVRLMFDGDEAGREANDKANKILRPYVKVKDAELAFGDPDQMRKAEFLEMARYLKNV